jgi:riboflavin kinase/FMN adenylyltransferase
LPDRPVHLAIGMFDGVHLGHRAVIGAAVEGARRDGGVRAVLTFSPHPSALFRPQQPTRLLEPEEAKAALLEECGVQAVITQPFTPEFAALSDEEFVRWLWAGVPCLRAVYVGENFRFGRGRAGTPSTLASHAAALGFTVNCLPRVEAAGATVSSTRIRALVAEGQIARANELLGRPYRTFGRVEPGKRMGRTLGFPTLNSPWAPPLSPCLGV